MNNYFTPVTYLDESGRRVQKALAHTLTSSATYSLAEKDELSLDITYSTRTEDQSYGHTYRDLNSARVLTGLHDRLSTGRGTPSYFETALAFTHGFVKKGHKLTAEASVVRDAEQQFHTSLFTRLFDNASNVFVPDASRINDFTFDQTVNAVVLERQRPVEGAPGSLDGKPFFFGRELGRQRRMAVRVPVFVPAVGGGAEAAVGQCEVSLDAVRSGQHFRQQA